MADAPLYLPQMSLHPPIIDDLNIETARLLLEPISDDHANELFELFADDRLHVFVPFEPPSLDQQRQRTNRWQRRLSPDGSEVWLNWLARDKLSGEVVGHFQSGYKADSIASIGYVVAFKYWGQGFAVEALTEIFRLLKTKLKIREIKAWSDTRNLASHRVASKLGMKQIELIKDADHFKGHSSDEFVFSINLE